MLENGKSLSQTIVVIVCLLHYTMYIHTIVIALWDVGV